METNNQDQFFPSSPIHPYDILEDELKARDIQKKDFAPLLGMKPSNFSRMLKARGNLSSETAMKLEEILGIPYSFWMKLQEAYLRDCIRLSGTKNISYEKDKSSKDIYEKLNSILKPIKEGAEQINLYMHNQRLNSNDSLSLEEVNSIEAYIHRLGKTLCKVKL
ncbi:MAG: helix-turn-helix domain-containing protein [Muribaculaceae bacterium]|nr:helix-turn-helix domain-containing protein [Muribaculaceae bacterium]